MLNFIKMFLNKFLKNIFVVKLNFFENVLNSSILKFNFMIFSWNMFNFLNKYCIILIFK